MSDETLVSTANESGGLGTGTREGHNLLLVSDAGIRNLELPKGSVLRIGRREDMDIVIDHPAVSREHALLIGGETPQVEDLGSRNGTNVQGAKIAARKRIPLRIGFVVSIGNANIFVRSATGSVEDEEPLSEKTSPGLQSQEWGPRSLHPEVQDLYERVKLVAQSNIPILVLGETGSGKELLAERIHAYSKRSHKPMLRVNCAALSEGILASELFGHEKGAFTGAHATKIGLFEAADGGTLFLDEVGELTPATQAKLLRVLETGEVTRVGSHKPRHVDVRVIAATNRDLRIHVARGEFRSDLFFRLNGISVALPALRRRPNDILPLAAFFAERIAARLSRSTPGFTPEAESALKSHRWPGNVRELKNVIERAVLLCPTDAITSDALQLDAGFSSREVETMGGESVRPTSSNPGRTPMATLPDGLHGERRSDRPPKSVRPGSRLRNYKSRAEHLKAELARAERDRIIDALEQAGTQAAAAEILGISRRALLSKLDALEIPRPRKGKDKE